MINHKQRNPTRLCLLQKKKNIRDERNPINKKEGKKRGERQRNRRESGSGRCAVDLYREFDLIGVFRKKLIDLYSFQNRDFALGLSLQRLLFRIEPRNQKKKN